MKSSEFARSGDISTSAYNSRRCREYRHYRPYITDAQGSVQALETGTGAPEPGSEVRYTPYGEQDATPSSTMGKQNPYRFQGFYYDPTARAYDALAREYRPDIQRFLTQDRFEAAGGDLALAQGSLTSDRYAFVAGNPTTLIEDDGHVSEQQREDAKRAAATLYKPGTAAYGHMLGFYLRDPVEAGRQLGVDSWVKAKDAESAQYLVWHADRQRRHTREAELRALPHPSLWQHIKGSAEIYGPFLPSGWVGSIARKVAGPVIEKVGPSLQRWGRNVLERLGILNGAPKALSTGDELAGAAGRAVTTLGPGRGAAYGTRAHSAFEAEVNALGRSDLATEVSYLNGRVVPRGTAGSVRLDVVEGSLTSPQAIYDLKTGSAALSARRIAQIRSHLPGGYRSIPVHEVRP